MASIRKRGANWQARVRVPGGGERARSFSRKVDAQMWAMNETAKIARSRGGSWTHTRAGRETLGSFAGRWLEGRTDLELTTKALYSSLFRCRILPAFGERSVASITPWDVASWNAKIAAERPATAALSYAVLNMVMKAAGREG